MIKKLIQIYHMFKLIRSSKHYVITLVGIQPFALDITAVVCNFKYSFANKLRRRFKKTLEDIGC